LKGVRAPDSDYPIENVNDAAFACNKGLTHLDKTVITVPAGAKVGAWWGHVIGGAQGANDPDHPIAKSHKGEVDFGDGRRERRLTCRRTNQLLAC
jgi:cellulase